MRLSSDMSDQSAIQQHTGQYKNKRALVILGGWSGRGWESVRDRIKPDIIIGVNGVNSVIKNLDYWITVESGSCPLLPSFQFTGAKYRLVHALSFHHLKDKRNAISVVRLSEVHSRGIELDELVEKRYNIREYGEGLLTGDYMHTQHVLRFPHRCGTVAVQAIHWASILGCSEIHTIGLDLYFTYGFSGQHHWYPDRQYTEDNRFWKPGMFFMWDGIPTSYFWFESAQYLLRLKRKILVPANIQWHDHSEGLLQRLDSNMRYNMEECYAR